ncbi:MAG: hypothetical protein LUD12_03625 [Lachnospiraceae bacterium]|nr:hypothetical protein [Lachnospiraceae bacterium]
MTFSTSDEKYLNEAGLDYLIDKLQDKIAAGSGNVDLTDYYTKDETDKLLDSISGGSGGSDESGADGVGIASVILENYELIITLTDGTEYNLGNVRGEAGTDGQPGADGLSPTIVENADNTDDVYKLDITDATGTFTTPNLKGADGADGSGSGNSSGDSGSGLTFSSTEETVFGTWIDGKTIYCKMYQFPATDSAAYTYYDSIMEPHGIENFGELVFMTATWLDPDNGSGYVGGSGGSYFINANNPSFSSVSNVTTYVQNYIEGKLAWVRLVGDEIQIVRGKSAMLGYAVNVFLMYTKSA